MPYVRKNFIIDKSIPQCTRVLQAKRQFRRNFSHYKRHVSTVLFLHFPFSYGFFLMNIFKRILLYANLGHINFAFIAEINKKVQIGLIFIEILFDNFT